MEVKLLTKDLDFELYKAMRGARTCYQSYEYSDNMGEKDINLLKKLVKLGHHSVLEHCVLTFELKGYSRAVLQQVSRHRMASTSVQSTRYTINKMVDNYDFHNYHEYFVEVDDLTDAINSQNVERTISILKEQIIDGEKLPNDKIKYTFPESLKVTSQLTINLRSLMNFMKQRLDSHALWEIREMAKLMYDELDDNYKELIDLYIEEC